MNRIFNFLEFFSTIEVQFFYHGKRSMEKSHMFSGEWDFRYFNSKSSDEFNEEIKKFAGFIILLEKELKEGTSIEMKGITSLQIQFALIKTEELAKKISTRGWSVFPNPTSVWFFNDPDMLKVACRYSEVKEEVKSYQDFPALINHVEELISEEVHWIKQCLDRLVSVLKSIIVAEIVIEKTVDGEEIMKTLSGPTKISAKSPKPAKYVGPRNFISPKFHYNTMKVLFEKLVAGGYIEDKPDQKRSFCKLFSETAIDKWVDPKIKWKGDQTTLRGLIRYFTDIVEIKNSRDFKWDVADKSFTVKGRNIHFTDDKTNGHYGPPSYREEIKRVIELSLKEEKLSED